MINTGEFEELLSKMREIEKKTNEVAEVSKDLHLLTQRYAYVKFRRGGVGGTAKKILEMAEKIMEISDETRYSALKARCDAHQMLIDEKK